MASTQIIIPATSGSGGAVDSVNGQTGVVVLAKGDIGLGNVDNTSDLDKPISTATQTALDLKLEASDIASKISSDPTGVTGADQVTNMISLTQAEYDAIGTKNPSTFYLITDAS